MQFIAIDESCGYTAMAVKDILPGEEIFSFYGSDYFENMEDGCPCRSCQPEAHKIYEAEQQEYQLKKQCQVEIDKEMIDEKRKARKKRRRDNQNTKGQKV